MRRLMMMAAVALVLLGLLLVFTAMGPGSSSNFEPKQASVEQGDKPLHRYQPLAASNQDAAARILALVEGSVFHQETGEPLVGARVWWAEGFPDGREPANFTITDAEGRYLLELTDQWLTQVKTRNQMVLHADHPDFHPGLGMVTYDHGWQGPHMGLWICDRQASVSSILAAQQEAEAGTSERNPANFFY